MKPKDFFTKNNPKYVGPVVSDTPRADGSNTLYKLTLMDLQTGGVEVQSTFRTTNY